MQQLRCAPVTVELRPYQSDLVDGIRMLFRQHRRVLAVASTGAGKTVIFCYIATHAAAKGSRVIIVAHRAEIVEQISAALDRMAVRHGRIMPGHPMTDDAVQVAMIQTIARRIDRISEPNLLVIDESHHAVAGAYSALAARWTRTRVLGVTATPRRLDGRGLGDAFDTIIEAPPMADLIGAGFLARFDYLAPPDRADLSAVRTRMGDYAVDDLAKAMDQSVITGDAIDHYARHMAGRPAIAFCVTVAHAEHVAAQFVARGYRALSVDGSMTKAERRDRLAMIGDGRLNVLTSCELISEGVDVPVVAGAILLRPTKSLSTYLQQVGRALRPKPDGSAAIILDHVGNVRHHGMPDAARVWTLESRPKREAAEPTATCEACYRVFAAPPGWKSKAECHEPLTGCILADAPPAPRAAPEEIAGDLVTISPTASWSRGIPLAAASGDEWRRLLRLADDEAKLREIAKARGFKPQWVQHIMHARRRFADRPVPFAPPLAAPSDPRMPPPAPAPAYRDVAADALADALLA